MKRTLKDYLAFCEERGLNPRLVWAVIKQRGRGWADWQELAPHIGRHGIDGGWTGFVYYSGTAEFVRRNRSLIADYADLMADGLGESTTKMVQGLGCSGYSEAEIGRCLYGRGNNKRILNVLAWFAAEACAIAFEDWHQEG